MEGSAAESADGRVPRPVVLGRELCGESFPHKRRLFPN